MTALIGLANRGHDPLGMPVKELSRVRLALHPHPQDSARGVVCRFIKLGFEDLVRVDEVVLVHVERDQGHDVNYRPRRGRVA